MLRHAGQRQQWRIAACIQDPKVTFLCVCCIAIGVYGAFGIWWSYPTTLLSGAAAAGAVGLINSFGNVVGYAGPYLKGYVREATGSFLWASVVLAGMLTAGGALMLTLTKKPPES